MGLTGVTLFVTLTFYLWRMILSLIVAADENNAIGVNNTLPWHLPEDLKFFKRTTLGKPVIMGRKTYESLGKPLPGRTNIVLSRGNMELPEGVVLCRTLETAIAHAEALNAEEAMVLGGGEIFRQAASLVDRMYITRVHTRIEGADTFFPAVDHTHWTLKFQEEHKADEKNRYDYTFETYERVEM